MVGSPGSAGERMHRWGLLWGVARKWWTPCRPDIVILYIVYKNVAPKISCAGTVSVYMHTHAFLLFTTETIVYVATVHIYIHTSQCTECH